MLRYCQKLSQDGRKELVKRSDELVQLESLRKVSRLGKLSSVREASYNRCANDLKRQMNIAMGCRTYRNALIPPYPLKDSFVPYELRHTL